MSDSTLGDQIHQCLSLNSATVNGSSRKNCKEGREETRATGRPEGRTTTQRFIRTSTVSWDLKETRNDQNMVPQLPGSPSPTIGVVPTSTPSVHAMCESVRPLDPPLPVGPTEGRESYSTLVRVSTQVVHLLNFEESSTPQLPRSEESKGER